MVWTRLTRITIVVPCLSRTLLARFAARRATVTAPLSAAMYSRFCSNLWVEVNEVSRYQTRSCSAQAHLLDPGQVSLKQDMSRMNTRTQTFTTMTSFFSSGRVKETTSTMNPYYDRCNGKLKGCSYFAGYVNLVDLSNSIAYIEYPGIVDRAHCQIVIVVIGRQ